MKKIYCLGALPLLALGAFAKTPEMNKADSFSIAIEENNNLANWKYDWNTVVVGSGKTSFDTGHLRMENINTASANYALYTTNKFNEFTLDMHANLNIVSASDLGITDGYDYANLYFTFFIDFEDAKEVENVAMAACPWAMNKGWLSVCFERLQGVSKVELLINETFDGAGGNRYYLANEVSSINYVDNQYHWFTIKAESVPPKNPDRIRYNEVGINISVYIDGVKQLDHFVADEYYSNTHTQKENIMFHEAKGYGGFWASSGYTASYNTENTGVAIDIDKLQITSPDGLEDKSNATPYPRCARPAFHLEANSAFIPEASYEVGEEVEIKLSDLFTYDGDNKLTYTAKCKGQNIGSIRNGYFVWTPEEKGKTDITFGCSDGDLSAENEIRFNVVEAFVPGPSGGGEEEKETTGGGCGGSIATASLAVTLLALGLAAFAGKKKNDEE